LCVEFITPLFIMQVPVALVKEHAASDDLNKYDTFILRSYVEDNKNMSWCTG